MYSYEHLVNDVEFQLKIGENDFEYCGYWNL